MKQKKVQRVEESFTSEVSTPRSNIFFETHHMKNQLKRRKTKNFSQPHLSNTSPRSEQDDSKGLLDFILPRRLADFIYVQLWEPVNPASLVGFRIMWGLLMFYESMTYIARDWAKLEYIRKLAVHFKY